jgi:hypothetical protein
MQFCMCVLILNSRLRFSFEILSFLLHIFFTRLHNEMFLPL